MSKFIQGITNYDEWRDHEKDNKKYLERMAIISELLPKKDCLTFADEVRLVMCIVVSALSGKLEDFWAISTSVLMNPICQARAKDDKCICSKCYAAQQAASRSTLCCALETNYLILNNFLISEEAWALLPIPSICGKARIESHGDTATMICTINYNRIIKSHNYLFFGVFSKNLDFWERVFLTEGKPSNMQFIASSPIINVVMEIPERMKWFVDHVFTVFEREYAIKFHIVINCGTLDENGLDHRCKLCFKCYVPDSTDFYLNELLKNNY